MPRVITSGDTRKANRLMVLSLKEAEPQLGASAIGRRLGLNESTVRHILRRWGNEIETGVKCDDRGRTGRPNERSKRWARCVFPLGMPHFQNFVLFRHLAKISQKNPQYSLNRLAEQMYTWELRQLQSRPRGARFLHPMKAAKETIRRMLREMGIRCRRYAFLVSHWSHPLFSIRAAWKPLLNKRHKALRRHFASKMMHFDWSKVCLAY